ncbi:MAG: hypothetical protein WC755_08445 [Candidatus Woesearchaeota archaeon]
MSYESIIDDILKIGEKKVYKDYWKERAEVPLLSKRPYYEYSSEEEMLEETLTLKIDTRGAQQRNAFNGLICAATGVGKTRLVKNIVKGFHKQKYNILFFEPKSTEMMNATKIGKGRKLAPYDFNERLPVVVYCPNYVKLFLKKNFPSMVSKVKFYSPDIAKLDYVEVWQSFGVPVKAAAFIVEMIQQGHYDLDYFETHMPKMHSASFQAVSTAIASLKALRFFGAKQKGIPLEEEWAKGNIVVVDYFSRDGNLMNTSIGLDLDAVRDIGIRESSKGLNNVSKKLLVFDDAFYYAGMSAMMATKGTNQINLAIRNIANCQNNFRTWGVDSLFIVQSPSSNAIMPVLIDGCTSKFVSYTENTDALAGKLPFAAYRLLSNVDPRYPMLYVREEVYLY